MIDDNVINVKKLQFIHTVNGDGSKTAKIIKGNANHTNIDSQAMLVWLTLPFMIFAVCINCSFFLHLGLYYYKR